MKNEILLVACGVILVGSSLHCSAARPISVNEARQLVRHALTSEALKLPGISIEGHGEHDPSYPDYYEFNVTWAGSPTGGSAIVGSFDVDIQTGDVFSATACESISNPALEKFQRRIRRTIALSDIEYAKLGKPGPNCQ